MEVGCTGGCRKKWLGPLTGRFSLVLLEREWSPASSFSSQWLSGWYFFLEFNTFSSCKFVTLFPGGGSQAFWRIKDYA